MSHAKYTNVGSFIVNIHISNAPEIETTTTTTITVRSTADHDDDDDGNDGGDDEEQKCADHITCTNKKYAFGLNVTAMELSQLQIIDIKIKKQKIKNEKEEELNTHVHISRRQLIIAKYVCAN